MDCILGYHLNPLTCGVGRFNRALGDQLGLPVFSMFSEKGMAAKRPLLSFKVSEMSTTALKHLSEIAHRPDVWPSLRLFFHDYSATSIEATLMRRAEKIYSGNEVITNELRALHPDVVQAWCPGFLFERRLFGFDTEVKIYTFGMAHKLRVDYFHLLHDLLERTGKEYMIYVSAAIHEGTSLDDSFTAAYEELRTIFGDKVFFVGFLSDAALYALLKECRYFAAFFADGVRANNTSVSTAMQNGVVVLTNLDSGSPPDFRHLETIVDIRQCLDGLPLDAELLDRVALNGSKASEKLGWSPLTDLFVREEVALQVPGRRWGK